MTVNTLARITNPIRKKQPSANVGYPSDIAKLLGIPEFDTETSGDTYSYAFRQAEEEGATQEEAEQFAQKAEEEEEAEAYRSYTNAVMSVANDLFGKHGLDLVLAKNGSYAVAPTESWEKAANDIRETINGVGYFHFNTLKEFLDSGPWTARQAVLEHLHWIKDYPRVYGEGTATSMFDRRLRNRY